MKITKTLLTVAAGSLMLNSASAEIALGDDATLSGYFLLGGYENDIDGDDLDTSVVELETAFNWDAGNQISAVAELSFGSANGNSDLTVNYETVTLTYAASDELSFTAGNILSYQGFETYDASGLYQSSYQGSRGPVYSAAYAVGASADYVAEDYGFGLWVGATDSNISVEALAQYTGIEGVTLKFIYANDPNYTTYNVWGSYEFDDTTLAAEFTTTEYGDGGQDDDSYMFLAYQAFGDAGLTLRYSFGEYGDDDYSKITVCPSYSFSDSVLGLVEASFVTDDGDLGDRAEYAAELLFTF